MAQPGKSPRSVFSAERNLEHASWLEAQELDSWGRPVDEVSDAADSNPRSSEFDYGYSIYNPSDPD